MGGPGLEGNESKEFKKKIISGKLRLRMVSEWKEKAEQS